MDIKCPYRGLQPLSKEDAAFFAGREKEIRVVISNLHGSSLTVLYGESGVGKTSLIRAGVLPELDKEDRVAAILFREWQSPNFERQLRDQVLKSLLDAINRVRSRAAAPEPPLSIKQLHDAFCKGLELPSLDALYAMSFQRFVLECSAAFYGKIFFIFDQFEEYIYYHPLKGDGEGFDRALASAINDRKIPASFLLSLREDGLGKLDRLRARIPDLLGNVVRLEHLNEDGARNAIEKPLANFSTEKAYTIKAEPELTDALLEQVNADRLEMDEDPGVGDPQLGDSGVRYKALALQAVLTRLWETDVVPLFDAKTCPTGTIWLHLKTLSKLADKKQPAETEVRFLIRTYFDEQLSKLTPPEVESAAEILRGLVRSGGHKRARTAEALARETSLPLSEVATFLEKMVSDTFQLLRKVDDGRNMYFELNHDVMAFAIMDWSNRQRQKLREDQQWKRQTLIRVGALALIALLAGAGWYYVKDREKTAVVSLMQLRERHRTLQRLVDSSLGYLGTANQLDFNPETGLLAAIDAIAEYRRLNAEHGRSDAFVSPRAVLTLAIANAAKRAARPDDIPTKQVYALLPCVESADRQNQLVLKTTDTVELKMSDDTLNEFRLDESVTQLGFDLKAEHFGVGLKSGKVITWSLPNLRRLEQKNGVSLASALNIVNEADSQIWFRRGPEGGWEGGYSDVINQHLANAIRTMTGRYPEADRPQIGVPGDAVTDKINTAYETLRGGNQDEAIRLLRQTFVTISLDPKEVTSVLAANLFRFATEPSNADKREYYFGIVMKLDPGLQGNIRAFKATEGQAKNQLEAIAKIDLGNQLAKDGKTAEAMAAYQEAIKLDPALKDKINPEAAIEAVNRAQAIALMEQGNKLAREGKKPEAIAAYKRAIELDQTLKNKVDPEAEWKRFSPGASGSPPLENP